jgi:hypothetical protein
MMPESTSRASQAGISVFKCQDSGRFRKQGPAPMCCISVAMLRGLVERDGKAESRFLACFGTRCALARGSSFGLISVW